MPLKAMAGRMCLKKRSESEAWRWPPRSPTTVIGRNDPASREPLAHLATALAFAIVLAFAALFACFAATLAFAAIHAFAVMLAHGGVGGRGGLARALVAFAARGGHGACDQSGHRGRDD